MNPVTANSGHSSGGPFSAWLPRSAKMMSEPATRSLTVRETRISAGRASSATRSAICTEAPAMSSPTRSTSPVWIPARIWIPAAAAPSRTAAAHRIACPGASKVARMSFAVVLISRPRCPRISSLVSAICPRAACPLSWPAPPGRLPWSTTVV